MKPAGKLITFSVLIVVVIQFNLCKAAVNPMEWKNFTKFKTLKHLTNVVKLAPDVHAGLESLEQISQNKGPRAISPEQMLVDVKMAYIAKMSTLDLEYKANSNQWGPVYEKYLAVAQTECAKIGLLVGTGALAANPELNVFATKLYMEWSSTAWVLARYSAQRHEGEMEVVNEEYPESVPHFV